MEKDSESPWTEGDIPRRKGNCNLLLVAPHGHPKDDTNTGKLTRLIADRLDCYAVINEKYQKPETAGVSEADPKNFIADLYKKGDANLSELKPLFLDKIQQYRKDILCHFSIIYIIYVHGIATGNTPKVANLINRYKKNPKKLQAVIGYGQWKENKSNFTANFESFIHPLMEKLNQEGLQTAQAPIKPIKVNGRNRLYCGWDADRLNQYLYDPRLSMQSIQLELKEAGVRKTEANRIKYAGILATAIMPFLDSAVQKRSIQQVKAGEIDLDSKQFRARIDAIESETNEFKQLVDSISKVGILNNIIVRRYQTPDKKLYQLISGFRRMAALKTINPDEQEFADSVVPAMVLEESVSDDEAYQISFTENLARQDLSLWEIAKACAEIQKKKLAEGSMSSGDIEEHLASLIHKNTRTVRRYLKLASVKNVEIVKAVHTGEISPTTALDIGKKELDENEISALLKHIKRFPKTTRSFVRFYNNLEMCSQKADMTILEVLVCPNADRFLMMEEKELLERLKHRREISGKSISEVLKGEAGSIVKAVEAMDVELANKSFQNRFEKASKPLFDKISEALEKSKISADFRIKPVMKGRPDEIAVTISAPADQIQEAIKTVSSEAGDKFVPLKKSFESRVVTKRNSKGWEIIKMKNESGENVEASAPLIVSASRRNDTPARHSKWFIEGLRRGYVRMSEKKYISYEKARVIVFWTKDAKPMVKYLDKIDEKGIGYYFQYTLTDYEEEKLEPNIPPQKERIETFKALSDRIGKEKVIWRFDPLVLTDVTNKDSLVEKVQNLMKELSGYTEKLVISFFRRDDYKHALERMEKNDVKPKDFEAEDVAFLARQIGSLGREYNIKIATCADKGNLSFFGIEPNKCVDDALMKRVFDKDDILMSFLNSKKSLKDPGQRRDCKCIVSEEIGKINTCANQCLYCYANKSDKALEKNLKLIENGKIDELLVPRS